ncbi:unnamed protein product, partial [Mesorhabditis spiculigera]
MREEVLKKVLAPVPLLSSCDKENMLFAQVKQLVTKDYEALEEQLDTAIELMTLGGVTEQAKLAHLNAQLHEYEKLDGLRKKLEATTATRKDSYRALCNGQYPFEFQRATVRTPEEDADIKRTPQSKLSLCASLEGSVCQNNRSTSFSGFSQPRPVMLSLDDTCDGFSQTRAPLEMMAESPAMEPPRSVQRRNGVPVPPTLSEFGRRALEQD